MSQLPRGSAIWTPLFCEVNVFLNSRTCHGAWGRGNVRQHSSAILVGHQGCRYVGPEIIDLLLLNCRQKGVQISHYNVISNVLQRATYESPWRNKHTNGATEVVMGCLPFSHIYGLVLICHTASYRGDQVIVLPKFELINFLKSISRFKIYELFIVPPVVVMMIQNLDMLRKYDTSSVKFLYLGAAPLGKELANDLKSVYPDWNICLAYGLTESATVVSSTSRGDVWPGSSGSLLPGAEGRIISADGKDIDAYDTPGEIWVKAPCVVMGYLVNKRATNETFTEDEKGRWLKTGDEGEVRRCPETGNEHLWIVDRIKELIKVNVSAPLPRKV